MNNLADKLQYVATEIYAMQDEQHYTREKQHNYKQGLCVVCGVMGRSEEAEEEGDTLFVV